MRERFGADRAGLSTGDASIQTDSPIMVMTTEILRNILYRTEEDSAEDNSSVRDSLVDVGLIVLDEVCLNLAPLHHAQTHTVIIILPYSSGKRQALFCLMLLLHVMPSPMKGVFSLCADLRPLPCVCT